MHFMFKEYEAASEWSKMTQDEVDDFKKFYEDNELKYAELHSLYVLPKKIIDLHKATNTCIMHIVGEINNGITKSKLEA